MPTHTQVTVDAVSTVGGLGSADTGTMQEMFPASPIHAGELTAPTVRTMGNELLITDEVNDGGHTFGTFSRDFDGSPDPADVQVGAGGLPGSAHTPAPGSPGPGSTNPADIPAPPAAWPPDPGTEYGVGDGGLLSPAVSAGRISGQTIGDYLFGRSSA